MSCRPELPTDLPVELSEIRTIQLQVTGISKTVSITERFIAIILIIPAELWDSGQELAEPLKNAEIMVTCRLHTVPDGLVRPVVLLHSSIIHMKKILIIL